MQTHANTTEGTCSLKLDGWMDDLGGASNVREQEEEQIEAKKRWHPPAKRVVTIHTWFSPLVASRP